MSEKLFTKTEVIRIAELAAFEATGEFLGCTLIAEKVVAHYDDEDQKMMSYVSDPKSTVEVYEIDLS